MYIFNPSWVIEDQPIDYKIALENMESYVEQMIANNLPNRIWLLEHKDVYTKGTAATNEDILANKYNIPIVKTNRGGKYTYHGEGQRIIYPTIDLNNNKDILSYIRFLEQWIIKVLNKLDIDAHRKEGLTGVWVSDNNQDKKIAAIGIRVRRWVAYHGISVNIFPNLDKFCGIIPCGVRELGLTSLKALNIDIGYQDFDKILMAEFKLLNHNYR